MTARLIVHGDDFGRSESLTDGVLLAFEKGILTSTSIVAGGLAFDRAVEGAKQNPLLDVGVELAADEYAPVCDPKEIPSLVDAEGVFPPRGVALRNIFRGRVDLDDLRKEWQAQVQKVVDAGIQPTHLVGHGHCHVAPPVADLVVDIAERFGIDAVRLPREPLHHIGALGKFSLRRYAEKVALYRASLTAKSRWKGRLRHPDALAGFTESGRLDYRSLDAISALLRPKLTELMAHPGVSDSDAPYGVDYNWPGDLGSLVVFTRPDFQRRYDVRLVSYRNAWDASG